MIPVEFDYYSPQTVAEAISLLDKYGKESKLLAGGLDLIRNMRYRVVSDEVKYVIGLKKIKDLRLITTATDGMSIGSAVSLNEIQESTVIKTQYLSIWESSRTLGPPQLKNQITLGGNLCQDLKCWHYNLTGISQFMRKAHEHSCWRKDKSSPCTSASEDDVYHSVINIGQKCWASSPSTMAVPLIALRAKVKIMGKEKREIPVEELYSVNGDCILSPAEMITSIYIPTVPDKGYLAYIADKRSSKDFPVVNVSVLAVLTDNQRCNYVKAAIGGVTPRTITFEKEFDSNNISDVIEEIKNVLFGKALIRGPATNFKVNEAKTFVKYAFQQIQAKGMAQWLKQS